MAKQIPQLPHFLTVRSDMLVPLIDLDLGSDGSGYCEVGLLGQIVPINANEIGVVDVRYAVGNVKRYGAIGDGLADDTLAIQRAIDNSIYKGFRWKVIVPAGRYKTSDTIHAGYGVASTHGGGTGGFNSIVIEGEGPAYRADVTVGGTAIIPTFSDRPCINFQGSRQSRLKHIGLFGKLYSYIVTNNLGAANGAVALLDDTLGASWQDGALAATQESRYAPYAGVTIDGYSGVAPATHYPTVNYPTDMGLGVVAQYGKAFSSDVILEDVNITGFNTAVVNQPCDDDGNGDFTVLRDCYFEMCKYGVSVGNSQSRGVKIDNVKFSSMFCPLTNNIHGRQIGKFDGDVNTINLWGCIQLFQFGAFFAQPITFTQLYAESMWRIGDITSSSTNELSVVFNNAELHFSSQNDVRGYPATILGIAGQPIPITFNGGVFQTYNAASVVAINQVGGVAFTGGFYHRLVDNVRTNPYEKAAHNALAGGFVFPFLVAPDTFKVRVLPFNLDTGTRLLSGFTAKWKLSSRVNCCPIYCETISASADESDRMFPPIPTFPAVSKSSLSAITLTGKTLSITFAARTDSQFTQGGPLPGDVILDDQTQSVFFVRSRIGLVVLAELQNNYKVVAGTPTPLTAFSTTVGNLYWRNSRIYTPTFYTRGDMTAASATISVVGRDDGGTSHLIADIAIGDSMLVEEQRDLFMSTGNNPITNVTAGTIVLTGSTNVRNQTRRRLAWFCRQPPANV